MLSLERPLGVVADLALFGDHAEPKRVYYAPTRPRLARVGDHPEMAFVKFRPADALDRGGVGLFSFTTELVATEEQLDAAREHLEDNGISEPVLGQIPWISGKAVFAAALAEGDGFTEKLLGEVTPDLAGSGRAVFSALLGEEGARLVEALLRAEEEGASPLGVRYELEYAGLRPAFDVRLRADYSRIYDEFSVGFQLGVAYQGVGVRLGVESATKKLVESGAIEVEVLHFTDDADLQQRVETAIKWFQDRILQEFFTSSLQPPAHRNLLDRAVAAATTLGAATLREALGDDALVRQIAEQLGVSPDVLRMLGNTGGAHGQAQGGDSTFALNLQFQLKDIKQDELKVITIDWSEARAERRTAAPQGLLMEVGPPPRIVEASESTDFWERLDVAVRPLGDLAALGVDRLIVELTYPDEETARPDARKALEFEAGANEPKRFSAWTNGNPPRYRWRAEVHFADEGPWPGPPTFAGPWHTSTALELAIHPLSNVPRVEIDIAPGTVSFADTPQVQLDFRIDGEQQGTVMMTEAEPSASYRRRLPPLPPAPEPAPAAEGEPIPEPPPRVEARATWFMAAGERVEGPWEPAPGTALLVHSPWRSQRTIRLFPMLPSDFVEAMVTLSLVGEEVRSQVVRFEPGDRRSMAITLRSLEDRAPPVRIEVLVLRGDSTTFVGEPFATEDPVVMIQDRDGQHRRVSVRLLAGEQLAAHGVMAVQVQLLGEGELVLDSVTFTPSQREPAVLLVPIEDRRVVRYRVVRFALDGSPTVAEAEESAADELLIPASIGT